jgi:hypothetical protein
VHSKEAAVLRQTFDNTFYISSDIRRERSQLRHSRLIGHLEAAGLKQLHKLHRDARPLFVWAEVVEMATDKFGNKKLNYSSELFHLHCGVKNILEDSKYAICRKDQLYKNMCAHWQRCPRGAREFMEPTFTLGEDPLPAIRPNDVFIIRPVEGHGGIGISVCKFASMADLEQAAEYARLQVAEKIKTRGGRAVVVTRYVTNPLLWNGTTKFHLRMYLLASVFGGVLRTFLWDVGKVFTAGKPFVNDQYHDSLIHDTHVKSTDGHIECPRDLSRGGLTEEQGRIIHCNVAEVLRCVSAVLRRSAKCYPESKAAFEVFGADILVREDLSVVLMEINDKVGYGFRVEEHAQDFSARYFDWVDACVIKPLMGQEGIVPLYCSKLTIGQTCQPAQVSAHFGRKSGTSNILASHLSHQPPASVSDSRGIAAHRPERPGNVNS